MFPYKDRACIIAAIVSILFAVSCTNVDTDVLVIGGGTAGVPAAIEAANCKCDVTLVESGSQLGGNMTTGGVSFPGLFHAYGHQIISGIGWDLVRESVELDGGTLPDFTIPFGNDHPKHQILINPFIYASLAEEKCIQAGVHIRYYEFPVKIVKRPYGWKVTLVGKGTNKSIRCRQIVDASGDASAVALAGFERIHSENPQPGSLIFQLGGYDVDALDMDLLDSLFRADHQNGRLSNDDCYIPIRNLLTLHQGLASSHVQGADASTSQLATDANIRGRAGLLRLVRVLKTYPGLEKLTVKSAQPATAIRESWRINGLYEVTLEDYVGARHFDDAVCYSFYPIDLHNAEGVEPRQLTGGDVPTVPLRALIPAGIRNIIVCGKSLSSDQMANSALRVQATSMATGQAAGAAAALAVKHQCSPADIPFQTLADTLRSHGATVPQ